LSKIAPLDLRREDFQKMEGDAIDRLLRKLNQHAGEVSGVLNGGGTLGGNLNAFVKDVEFTSLPITVRNDLTTRPRLVWIGYAVDTTAAGQSDPVSLGSVGWAENQKGEIVVSAITGLTAAHRYRVRLIVAAG
jgi:hypothetical protein